MHFDDLKTRRRQPLEHGDGLRLDEIMLIVRSGADRGLSVKTAAEHARIGTAPGSHLRLRDEAVSRHHCEISWGEHGYRVRDLGSTNGTYVGRARITEAFLEPGATFAVGGSTIELGAPRALFSPPCAELDLEPSDAPAMRELHEALRRLAPTALSCVIEGEPGTGKEHTAAALHRASSRASGPFVVVDCSSLQGNFVEVELFGHERGAFTGAHRARDGAFVTANGGTLVLDRLGELDLASQTRLLRVLETGEVRPLGSAASVPVDVRIVALTSEPLENLVERGALRSDLYFRVAQATVRVPPLRERREDLRDIVSALLARERADGVALSEAAWAVLDARLWRGNIRELQSALRRGLAFVTQLPDGHARIEAGALSSPTASVRDAGREAAVALREELDLVAARALWLEDLEKIYLTHLLERYGADTQRAAEHAGMHRKSLARVLRRHSLSRAEDADESGAADDG